MKKALILTFILTFILTIMSFVCYSVLRWEPLHELTAKENYTVLKSEADWSFLGSGQTRRYLLQIDDFEAFTKDCNSFFSTGNENSDAYFYCEYFCNDASEFSTGYTDALFSSISLKMWRNEMCSSIIWRCILSENKKYCYIEWISR